MHSQFTLLFLKKKHTPGYTGQKHTRNDTYKVYILPHTVCCKPYVRAFQYKVLNSILYTNTKLYKDNKCSFCKSYPEIPQSPLFCLYILADVLERLYFHFISEECVFLSLKDVIIVKSTPPPLAKLLVTGSEIVPIGLQKEKHATRNN